MTLSLDLGLHCKLVQAEVYSAGSLFILSRAAWEIFKYFKVLSYPQSKIGGWVPEFLHFRIQIDKMSEAGTVLAEFQRYCALE
jgi:hypothetical protein